MGYVSSRKRAGILAGFLIATVPVCSKADTPGSPVVVHRKVGSEACELVQHGSFILDKEFAWVEIEGEKAPVYSPELGPDDYLSVSSEVSRRTSKDAHKSVSNYSKKTLFLVTYRWSVVCAGMLTARTSRARSRKLSNHEY
jgi:hypothetical protein